MIACQALINLEAFAHNIKCAKSIAPHSSILAMLKANAYGHGALTLSPTFSLMDYIGVARIEEAIELHEAGIKRPIVIMSGFHDAKELEVIAGLNLQTVIHHERQLQLLENTIINTPLNVWLKIDSGMHRLGLSVDEANHAFQRLSKLNTVKQITVMTHLTAADELDANTTAIQLDRFYQHVGHLQKTAPFSIGNSAAILERTTTHVDIIRPGLMLYGISPIKHKMACDYNLQPVMTLQAAIIDIKSIEKGESVGYGATWQAKKKTHIAIAAIGYGDGYPQSAPNGTPVLVNQQEASLAGRVSMDMISIDITGCENVTIGDPVTLWGKGLAIEKVAKYMAISPYSLVAGINKRVKRMAIGEKINTKKNTLF